MKTRAAVLRQIGLPHPYKDSRPLAVEEVELAPPGRDEVLVRVRAAGLCKKTRLRFIRRIRISPSQPNNGLLMPGSGNTTIRGGYSVIGRCLS